MSLTVLGPLGSDSPVPLPLFLSRGPAGFPSPADDYVEAVVDLNEVCGVDGVQTYLVRVDPEGFSMVGANIWPGDVLVVDRAAEAGDRDIVIASVGGELTVKTVRVERGRCGRARRVWLEPEADGYDADVILASSFDPATVEQVQTILGGRPVDVLLIDGDHSIHGVACDAYHYAPLVRPGGLVIFHDCGECENDGMARRHRPSVNAVWRDLGERKNTLLVQGFTGFGLVWV